MNRSAANSPWSPALVVGILSVIVLVRCGGITAPSKNMTEGPVDPPVASGVLAIDAGASCLPNAKGQLHRCQSSTCSVSGVGQPLPCTSDRDCELNDAGVLYQGTCAAGVCRLDQCFTDSDCPMGTACSCDGDFGGKVEGRNWCRQANCRTDSDCGPGNVCSPSIDPGPCGTLNGFFCRTPQDTCATDADCALQGSLTSCQYVGPPLSDVPPDGAAGPPGSWTCVEPGHCASG